MTLAPAALLLAGATGCVTLQTEEDIEAQNQRVARLETSVKTLQENNQQLQAQVEEVKQDMKQVETAAASKEQLREVLNEVAALGKQFERVDATAQKRGRIARQIQSELEGVLGGND